MTIIVTCGTPGTRALFNDSNVFHFNFGPRTTCRQSPVRVNMPGTGSYLQDVFLVQEGTLLRLGCIYLGLVVTEKKRFAILCIAPVLSPGEHVVFSNTAVSAAKSSLLVDSIGLLFV